MRSIQARRRALEKKQQELFESPCLLGKLHNDFAFIGPGQRVSFIEIHTRFSVWKVLTCFYLDYNFIFPYFTKQHWLDPASRISRQLKPKSDPYDLYFGVKFYAADPCKLLEEITR